MARLSTRARKALPRSAFAVPGKAPASGSYPIPDASHARNALARVSQHGSPTEKAKVRAAVARKYPSIAQRSTQGSPPFSAAELNQGFRSLGPA
jgi:hypothetical protein